jgi:hypothetical protein
MIRTMLIVVGAMTLLSAVWLGQAVLNQPSYLPDVVSSDLESVEKRVVGSIREFSRETLELAAKEPVPDKASANISASGQDQPALRLLKVDQWKGPMNLRDSEPEPAVVTEAIADAKVQAIEEATSLPLIPNNGEPTDEQLQNIQNRLSETINQMERVLSSLER